MTSLAMNAALALGVAEVTGAGIFHATKNTTARRVLKSFGLGFAVAIVLFDLLPDATEHFAQGYALAALGAAIVAITWTLQMRVGKSSASTSIQGIAIGGMALHNFSEGIVLASLTGPLGGLFAAGALLHKLPEGMATYAMLGGEKKLWKFAASAAVALAIPLGVMVHLPEALEQAVMATLSGMILLSVGGAIFTSEQTESGLSLGWMGKLAPYVAGCAIGAFSCLIA